MDEMKLFLEQELKKLHALVKIQRQPKKKLVLDGIESLMSKVKNYKANTSESLLTV